MDFQYDDHKVLFRREETIEEIALAWRRTHGNVDNPAPNVVDFILRTLKKWERKGRLSIEFVEQPPGKKPAWVTFRPLTLHVDREVWDLADRGEPESRFIVAHEIGHIILHDHNAQGFSEDPSSRIKFVTQEESAEWQADTFAGYFLVPTHIAVWRYDRRRLAAVCAVPRRIADRRMFQVRALGLISFAGDACLGCSNFTLVRNGTTLTCDTCGRATGFFE